MGASEKAAAAYHGAHSPVLVEQLAADIRDATRRQMLPAAALADELVRRGWRPVVDNSAFFAAPPSSAVDYTAEVTP